MMESVRFTIADVYGGLGKCGGVCRLEKARLMLEYQTKDAILGALKSQVKVVCFPLEDLDRVEFKKGFIGGRLRIRARTLSVFEKIPGVESGILDLHVERKERGIARALASEADLRIAELRLDAVRSEDNSPPPVPGDL